MPNLIRSVVLAGPAFFRTRRELAVEILALRQQLGVLKRSVKRPLSWLPVSSAAGSFIISEFTSL